MTWFDKLKGYGKQPAANRPEISALREALETGQRAKRAEDFPTALNAFNRALSLAATDPAALVLTAINQAEVHIALKQWDAAQALLERAEQTARSSLQRTLPAYVLDTFGLLSQAKGEWEGARQRYEQALETARAARAAGAEGRAMSHLAAIYLRESNASYAAHLLREALPRLNQSGDLEPSCGAVGLLGQTLIETGQEAEGHALLERALRLSRQLNYRAYERHWSVILGERALNAGRFDEAAAYLNQALALFENQDGTPEHAHALCLSSRVALAQRQAAQAADSARAAVDYAAAAEDAGLLADARGILGAALLALDDYSGAIEHLSFATDNPAALNGKNGLTHFDLLRYLAAAYEQSGQSDRAVATFRQAAERAETAGLPLELAQIRRDLGLLYMRQRRPADAVREWSSALGLYESAKISAQVARLACDIAAARKFLGQGSRALKDYETALMALNDLHDDWETRGLVLSNAANAYVDQGDIESAEAFFNESIAIARRLGDHAAEATRRGNYGWFLLMIGKPQQALSALHYAQQSSRQQGLALPDAIQTDNIGLAYDALEQPERALEQHQEALGLVTPLNNPHWQAVITSNLASTLLTLNRPDEAAPLFEETLAAGRSADDIELIVRGLIGLARVALARNEAESAADMLEEAASLSRKADMRRLQAEALAVYSQQRAQVGQNQRAAALWDEAAKLYGILHMPQAHTRPLWLTVKAADQ